MLGAMGGDVDVYVEQHGRHRYYRLAGPHIAELLESVARLAPVTPVRSLRDDTNATALRRARTCYRPPCRGPDPLGSAKARNRTP